MMLFSGGGVGKSFVSIRVALTFVNETGKKVALWLTEDSEGETRSRYELLLKNFGGRDREFFDSRIDFISSAPVKLTSLRDGNAELTDDFTDIRLQLFDYSLVVLDPLLHFQGCDENSNTHAGVLMNAMQEWCKEEQKIVMLLHHASFSNGRLKARGAGEWINGTRGVYQIMRIEDSDGNLDKNKYQSRVFTLTKDNGLSTHFRDPITYQAEKEFVIFPEVGVAEEFKIPKTHVRISVANHDNIKVATGFEQQTLPFDALHYRLMEGHSYSQFTFAEGHRKSDNNMGYSDTLILDFDDGMTLTQAEKNFANFRALVVTTKSHRLSGNGDRFRVILKLKTPLIVPPEDFKDIMSAMFLALGEPDAATKDMARAYRASPSDALHFYTTGSEFDWEPMYQKLKRDKVKKSLTERRKVSYDKTMHQGAQSNTMPADTSFITDRGDSVSFGTLRDTLSYGWKQAIQCRHGHGHNQGKGAQFNAAAFVLKANNGNVFYHCSGNKCAGEEVLWCEDE